MALVPTGMNWGVSTTPWVSVSFPARARVAPSAGGGTRTSYVDAVPRVWGCHASGVSGGSTIGGRSHSPGIPGSWRRGGGIS